MGAEIRNANAQIVNKGEKIGIEVGPKSQYWLSVRDNQLSLEAGLIHGCDMVLVRGLVFTTKEAEGISLNDGKTAIEILNDGRIRLIIGQPDGFKVVDAMDDIIYRTPATLVSKSGAIIVAIIGEWR